MPTTDTVTIPRHIADATLDLLAELERRYGLFDREERIRRDLDRAVNAHHATSTRDNHAA